MNLSEQTITRNQCTLHYWLGGDERAPLVVFTHGAGVDHREFDAALPPVIAAGFRALAWDVRGHGLSRPGTFSPQAVVDDLAALLDSVGARAVILVGHSMGGSLSQEFAFRFPERVRAMLMLDCAWNYQEPSGWENFQIGLATPILKIYPFGMLVNLMAATSADSAAGRAYLRDVFGALGRDAFVDIIGNLLSFLRHEPDYVFGKPILMLVGDKDTTGNIRKTAAAWAQHETQSELHIIPTVSTPGISINLNCSTNTCWISSGNKVNPVQHNTAQ